MASQGATLQNYNNELVSCIEDLREKREEINVRCLIIIILVLIISPLLEANS